MNLIKKPIISEKSLKDAKAGFYSFVVEKAAKKQEIAKAIENMFDVNVIDINTSNYKDEKRQQRRVRSSYIISGFKKAVVKLKKGQKIGLFEAETVEVETAGSIEGEPVVKEKKSMLKGTKVKIEKMEDKKKKEGKE